MKSNRLRMLVFFLSGLLMTLNALAQNSNVRVESKPNQSKKLSAGFFSFYDGPGLDPDLRGATPNARGGYQEDGQSLFNIFSLKYQAWEKWALDLQIRTQIVFNQATLQSQSQTFRWQSPRIGVSGQFLKGEDWSLSGAVNTDLPYFLPSPLGGGLVSTQNTLLLNPGMFASFNYQPRGSRFSLFSLVTPRFFIYSNDQAMDPQAQNQGLSWEAKNHFQINLAPTLNYAINDNTSLRLGATVSYRKLLGSSWNPFQATTRWGERGTDAWHLWQLPILFGVNHAVNQYLSVFPFIQAYPLTAQRENLSGTRTASFLESSSFGMWISGSLF